MQALSFLKYLLPINFTPSQIISNVMVYVVVLYFLFEVVKLFLKTNKIHNQIKLAIRKPEPEIISGISSLKESWRKYYSSFITQDGKPYKTPDTATGYFKVIDIFAQEMNLRSLLSVSGTLVGLGILGTFIGLTFGISGFDVTNSDNIRKSIAGLLSGMGTAFVTSVWGMVLSIIFGVIEKSIVRRLSVKLSEFCSTLDFKYHLTKQDELAILEKEQRNLLSDFFVLNDDPSKPVGITHILRDMLKNSDEQTKALKSFSTDLADGIRISTETINMLGGRIADQIQQHLRAELTPLISGLGDSIAKLSELKEQSSSDFIEKAIANLELSLQKMTDRFQTTISGSTVSQLETLSATVHQTTQTLSTFPTQFTNMMADLRSQFNSFQDSMSELTRSSKDASAEAASKIRNEFEIAAKSVNSNITSVQENLLIVLEQQSDNLKKFSNMSEGVTGIIEKCNNANGNLVETANGISALMAHVDTLSSALTATTNILGKSGESLHQIITSMQTERKELAQAQMDWIENTKQLIGDAHTTYSQYSSNFSVIQSGLQSIFSQIQAGLKQYQDVTKESLNEHLANFASSLQTAVSSLAGTVEGINDIVEDVHEAVEICSKTRNINARAS